MPEATGLHGILLLDKPLGLSSNQALQRVRRVAGRPPAGHTGSLDPLATGMLPICVGEATKIAGLLLGARKAYTARIAFGARTSTGDAEGEIVERRAVPNLSREQVEQVLKGFLGPRDQVPPMYSAVHVGGVRLYQLARQGVEVDRAPRRIVIERLELGELADSRIDFSVTCSTGTYIRVLAEEVAEALGTVGSLQCLHRDWAEPFEGQLMVRLDELEAAGGDGSERVASRLLPIETALAGRDAIDLDEEEACRIGQGQRLVRGGTPGLKILFGPNRRLLGLGELDPGGILRPRRLFSWAIDSRACMRNTAVERGPSHR